LTPRVAIFYIGVGSERKIKVMEWVGYAYCLYKKAVKCCRLWGRVAAWASQSIQFIVEKGLFGPSRRHLYCIWAIFTGREETGRSLYIIKCVCRDMECLMPTWSNRERAKPIHPSPAHAAGDSSHTHTLHPVNLQQLGRGEK
jgi:hypothetical protein